MNQIPFKDLFSTQSKDYALYRPTYPRELFDYIADLSNNHECAWDCGTGNGQAAVELTRYFNQVVATDPSEKQILAATKHPNVAYEVGRAEDYLNAHPGDLKKFDLITVAQAFHWLDHKTFANVAKKVLKPKGHLAVWSYALAHISPEVDLEVTRIYTEILGDYWEKERGLVESGYQTIEMPFDEINVPDFSMQAFWTIEHLVGYLQTWSAVQSYIKKNGTNPIQTEMPALKKAWGSVNQRYVTWPLSIRIWKINH